MTTSTPLNQTIEIACIVLLVLFFTWYQLRRYGFRMHPADAPCANCGRDYADHNYVRDSITDYECPEQQYETGYGCFHGGDPRNFFPIHEDSMPHELDAHKAACKLWDEAEARGETPTPEQCPSGWITDATGKKIIHVLVAPYGIGIYRTPVQSFFELFEPLVRTEDDE